MDVLLKVVPEHLNPTQPAMYAQTRAMKQDKGFEQKPFFKTKDKLKFVDYDCVYRESEWESSNGGPRDLIK